MGGWFPRIGHLIQSRKPRHRESFALDEIDLRMRRYLNFRNGFFVEAGANDGIDQTNTLYYERYFGWTGLLIEPIPELADRCRRNRPKCTVEACALVPLGYPSDLIEMRYCNLMSVVKGTMKTEEEREHIRVGCEIQRVEARELTVAAQPLTEILDRHGIRTVDFLSLDVEGSELQALQGLDFERYRPRFMLIEARNRAEIDAYLEPWYRPIDQLSHHDVLYIPREEARR